MGYPGYFNSSYDPLPQEAAHIDDASFYSAYCLTVLIGTWLLVSIHPRRDPELATDIFANR